MAAGLQELQPDRLQQRFASARKLALHIYDQLPAAGWVQTDIGRIDPYPAWNMSAPLMPDRPARPESVATSHEALKQGPNLEYRA